VREYVIHKVFTSVKEEHVSLAQFISISTAETVLPKSWLTKAPKKLLKNFEPASPI